MNISIAKDFSDTPLGRFRTDSDFSGEAFREDHLVPALRTSPVVVCLDEVEGLGSSFLEEAFGGLVRKGHFTAEELAKILTIETSEQELKMYVKLAGQYIREAKRERS